MLELTAVLIRETNFCAIDFESAGNAPGRTDHPVQVGMARGTHSAPEDVCFTSYLSCPVSVTWSARRVHGISDEMLEDAPSLLSLWPELKRLLLGAAVVAHGKGTEKRFLRTFPGHGFGPWIDTLLLARTAWPDEKSHSLSDLCEARSLTGQIQAALPAGHAGRWHDALYDALASLHLLRHLITEFRLEEKPLDFLLHADLREWRRLRE
jgi:DNA polymerase III subunit epsilon